MASMKETQALFNIHGPYVMRLLNIDAHRWDLVKTVVVQNMGLFDEDSTYCGPGYWGDILVPDLCFRFAGYVHDGLYSMLAITDDIEFDKQFADKVFRAVMLSICDRCSISFFSVCDNILPEVYYEAVRIFGNPKKD